jgi:nitrite reductase/ring-hydroxylating ferredoxin subunit
VGSAVTGLTDWSETYGRGRKVGLVHGLLNVGATALYATSLVMRRRKKDAKGVPVLLVRSGGDICALAHTCSHLGGPLSEGKLEGDVVQCPWHGSRFNVRDGSVVDGPQALTLEQLPAFLEDVRVVREAFERRLGLTRRGAD